MQKTAVERHRFASGFRYDFFQRWSTQAWHHAAWSNILADHAAFILDLLVFSSNNRDLTGEEVQIACTLVEHGELLNSQTIVSKLLSVLDAQQMEKFLDANVQLDAPLRTLLLSNPRNLINFRAVMYLQRMRFAGHEEFLGRLTGVDGEFERIMAVYDWLESNVSIEIVTCLHNELGDLEFSRIHKLTQQWRKIHKNETRSR